MASFGAIENELLADFSIYRAQWLTVVPEHRITRESRISFSFTLTERVRDKLEIIKQNVVF